MLLGSGGRFTFSKACHHERSGVGKDRIISYKIKGWGQASSDGSGETIAKIPSSSWIFSKCRYFVNMNGVFVDKYLGLST